MIIGKLTTKGRTTIPRRVRKALGLKGGDEIAYTISGDSVLVTKATENAPAEPFAIFSEWDGEADRKAYAGL